jgi:hypothetical protein
MRIVIDSNQLSPILSKIVPHSVVDGIILAPYVFAETLLRSDAPHLLGQLRSFDLLIGLEPSDVLTEIAGLDEKGIAGFLPYDKSLQPPVTVGQQDVSTARTVKIRNRAFGDKMLNCAKLFRKRLRDQGLKHKFASLSEALNLFFLQSLVFDSVSNKNSRNPLVSDEKSLYVAVMNNRFLSRYFKMIPYYVISYSRAWADQAHNVDPSGTRDDWTDITLPLYAADGDIS